MKKFLLSSTMMLLAAYFGYGQTEVTLAAWTCPTGVDTVDLYPDISTPENANKYLSAEDTVSWPNTNLRDVTFTDGANTFAAKATGWNDGADSKLWSIKIKAQGYSDLRVWSKQSSSAGNPGPRDWKIQARLSGEDWVDLNGGTIICSNDWTGGIANALELPPEFNNTNSSIYIRWIMTSNISTNGTVVAEDGIAKIDDIFITGISPAGVEEVIISKGFGMYPNPCGSDELNIAGTEKITALNIYSMQGKIVKTVKVDGNQTKIDVGSLRPGAYLVQAVLSNGNIPEPEMLIIK
ncbi:MAG: T9SS type A sorting domain-containing protein [Bacteroidales bacterium]|nr:T9SS type A sorting domain-containing protein [Bacteroidales bacterium]